MFYSHEILTDRKHGVATIWLVATLGSRSSLKKITRKAIMDVDVPNACDTITDPAAPMALRLQGSLLYGVSRVFSQQCAYVLTDMQSLRDKMRGLDIVLKALEIDPSVVTTRPEQLNLQADPTFNIDLDLGFDLSSFDLGSSTEPSSLLSPRTLPSSQTGSLDHEGFLGLAPLLNQSSSHGAGADNAFDYVFDDFDTGFQDDDQTKGAQPLIETFEEEGVGFANAGGDEDDNILDITEDGEVILRNRSERDATASDLIVANDDFPSVEIQDQDFDFGADVENYAVDGITAIADDASLVSENDTPHDSTVSRPSEAGSGKDDAVVDEVADQIEADMEQEEDVVTGTAPQRAARTKIVPFDYPAEVPNRTLAEWHDNYLEFMEIARVEKLGKISVLQAKRNAAYWVLDQGLGDVASNFREDYEQHPLAIFSGQALIESLIGPVQQVASRKRHASAITEDDVGDGSQRSKKARTMSMDRSPSIRRNHGEAQAMEEDEIGISLADDDVEVEVGRGEQIPLPDHLADMPWNANAYASSRAGSVQKGLSVAGASSSMHGRGTFDVNLPSSNVKRVSQLIRESPLDRRRRLMQSAVRGGSSNGDNTDLMSLGGGFDIDAEDLDAQLAGDPNEEFELSLPVGDESAEDSATNRWVSESLEQEAFNFLGFLHTTIQNKEQEGIVEMDDGDEISITFEELLPLASNNEMVAAQGLLHVLSLATKGLINVRQDTAFGAINLGVVGMVAADSGEGEAEADEAEGL